MDKKSYSISHKTKVRFILAILGLSLIVAINSKNLTYSSAHSTTAYPSEIFSIWNNTDPSLDGQINFKHTDQTTEWAYAAVFNMYDSSNSIGGKLIIQNSNSDLFVGLDGLDFTIESPITDWGAAIYFDIDHNGYLTTTDRALRYLFNSSGSFVEFLQFNPQSNSWITLESGSLDVALAFSGIVVSSSFSDSGFDNVTNHRQHEIKIPFTAISSGPGRSLGVAFEMFDDYSDNTAGITWPFIMTDQHNIRTMASVFGDISFAAANSESFDFVVEENLNIKSSAIGYNNGSYITSGDIDGDGDLELIVSSNRTVLGVGEENLLSIFDYVGGEYQRIWSSWETAHQALINFPIKGLAAYDFSGDGKDELFACGTATTLLRFSNWNTTSDDFDSSEIVFTHTHSLTGYLTIGDGNNDGYNNIIFSDQNGKVNVIIHNSTLETFVHDKRSPFTVNLLDDPLYRVHAVVVGDPDDDLENEVLFLGQTSADDQLSTTRLYIYLKTAAKYLHDPDDDLPSNSIALTEDRFGHTIIVADVDNDLTNEIIIVGKDYLRIFESDTFTDPEPLLEFSLNDGITNPKMAGGAAVGDLNNDGLNELVFSAGNGTLYIGTVIDGGSTLSFTLNWSGDFGTSLGYHSSMIIDNFDTDSYNELVVSDNYGQILVIGKGNAPELSINNPSDNYVSSYDNVMVEWSVTDDHQIVHHIDIYVKGIFSNRVGGSQTGTSVHLTPGQNQITVVAFDFSGINDTDIVTVKFDVGAPQVTITSPINYYQTDLTSVDITYTNDDPDEDFDYYKIYRNGTEIAGPIQIESYPVELPSDGIWNITVEAVDDTLLKGRDSIFVIRDQSPPIITIDSPNDGKAVKVVEQDVTWSASDALTAVDYYDVIVNSIFYNTTTSKSMTVTLDTDKDYTIEVIAYDVLSNFASDSITITRDTVSPTITIDPLLLPTRTDGVYYTNNPLLPISWNATDNLLGTGISQTHITVNSQLVGTYSASESDAIIVLGNDSIKTIFIETTDEAGNVAEDYTVVILDRTAPLLTINNPVNNYTTGLDYIVISWNAYDAGVGIEEYIILVDGLIEDVLTDPEITQYQISIPLTKTYLITVRAIDILDYSFQQSINVTHDPNAPTIMISNPTTMSSYENETTITLDWVISGLTIDYFEIYVNGSYYNTYTSTTYTAFVDLVLVSPDELQKFNVTINAVTFSALNYTDFRWIIVDQQAPVVGFNSPDNDDFILTSTLEVEWFGNDAGSGVQNYKIVIDDIISIHDASTISHILDVTGLDGSYSLKIIIYDIAGNSAFEIITIQIELVPPEFTTSLGSEHICNDLNMSFILSLDNPHLGIKSISIIADNTNAVFSIDYGTSYQTEFYWLQITVTETDFLGGLDHNVTISVFDRANRETRATIPIILDQIDPEFWRDPVFDNSYMSNEITDINLVKNQNIHNISVTIFEIHTISSITLTIVGQGYNETFQMLYDSENSYGAVHQYYIEVDFTGLEAGDYSLIFDFVDIAGNSNSETYSIRLIPTVDPSGFKFLYIILGIAIAIIISFILALSLRRTVKNIGWRNELVVVAYVLKSGLTSLFVPYSPEFVTDEQLFGGAMTGIRSILEEIIGGKDKFEVQIVEFGEKHMLIYSGLFGDCVLLVRSIKPMHTRVLTNFSDQFERDYTSVLEGDTHVTLSDYMGAESLVEDYFGKREPLDAVAYQLYKAEREQFASTISQEPVEPGKETLVSTFYHEIISQKSDAFLKLPSKVKVLLGDAISFAEESLTDLISDEFKTAEKKASVSLKSLDLARQQIEKITDFAEIFDTIPKIDELVIQGAVSGRRGNSVDLHKAIEMASQLFLAQIT